MTPAKAAACCLLPFILLATANSAGYRYGASDQAFYAPAVMQRLDPALFPRDAALIHAQAHLTLMDETVAALSRATGLSLPILFALLYVLTLSLLVFAAASIGSVLYRHRWTTIALLAAVTLRHAIARSGTNTLEGYFHPRQLAFAFGTLAIAAFLRGRYTLVAVFLGFAATLHPTTTLWFAIWMGVAVFAAEARWRKAMLAAGAAAVAVAVWFLTVGPLAARVVRMDAAWLAAIGTKDYLFPLRWPAIVWTINLGYVVAIALIYRYRAAHGLTRPREPALVAGCLSLLLVFAVALPLQPARIALAIQLQPARIFWMLDFLAVIYGVWALAEGRRGTTRRARGVALVIATFSLARGVYGVTVGHEDRALAQVTIEDDDWGRTMVWAQTTERSSGWLADPYHAARYGTSVRVAGARDVFVEAIKDEAVGMYDRDIALRTHERIGALSAFAQLDAAYARILAARYNLDYLVTEGTLDLPLAFESGSLRVYRLR